MQDIKQWICEQLKKTEELDKDIVTSILTLSRDVGVNTKCYDGQSIHDVLKDNQWYKLEIALRISKILSGEECDNAENVARLVPVGSKIRTQYLAYNATDDRYFFCTKSEKNSVQLTGEIRSAIRVLCNSTEISFEIVEQVCDTIVSLTKDVQFVKFELVELGLRWVITPSSINTNFQVDVEIETSGLIVYQVIGKSTTSKGITLMSIEASLVAVFNKHSDPEDATIKCCESLTQTIKNYQPVHKFVKRLCVGEHVWLVDHEKQTIICHELKPICKLETYSDYAKRINDPRLYVDVSSQDMYVYWIVYRENLTSEAHLFYGTFVKYMNTKPDDECAKLLLTLKLPEIKSSLSFGERKWARILPNNLLGFNSKLSSIHVIDTVWLLDPNVVTLSVLEKQPKDLINFSSGCNQCYKILKAYSYEGELIHDNTKEVEQTTGEEHKTLCYGVICANGNRSIAGWEPLKYKKIKDLHVYYYETKAKDGYPFAVYQMGENDGNPSKSDVETILRQMGKPVKFYLTE